MELTEAALLDAACSVVPQTAGYPNSIVFSHHGYVAYSIMFRAIDQNWDRRRRKRELRKGELSTYSKASA